MSSSTVHAQLDYKDTTTRSKPPCHKTILVCAGKQPCDEGLCGATAQVNFKQGVHCEKQLVMFNAYNMQACSTK